MPRIDKEEAQRVLARELAARAAALERGLAQIDLGVVRLGGASLALTSECGLRAPQVGPPALDSELAASPCRAGIRGQGEYLLDRPGH